jgi:hypothetical protein
MEVQKMSKITKEQALELAEKLSSQPKRTYVRVGERGTFEYEVEGTDLLFVVQTKVYSSTWSKNKWTLYSKVNYGSGWIFETNDIRKARKLLK